MRNFEGEFCENRVFFDDFFGGFVDEEVGVADFLAEETMGLEVVCKELVEKVLALSGLLEVFEVTSLVVVMMARVDNWPPFCLWLWVRICYNCKIICNRKIDRDAI